MTSCYFETLKIEFQKQTIIFIYRHKTGQILKHLSWLIGKEGTSEQVHGNFIIP